MVALEDGDKVRVQRGVIAAGIEPFKYKPDVFKHLDSVLASHCNDGNRIRSLSGKRVAVIGAGQSALESAELARRLSGTCVTSNVVDPGDVATNLGRNNGWIPWLRHLTYYAANGQLIMPTRAASHINSLALAEEIENVTGQYFFEGKPLTSSRLSHDITTARELWSSGINASLGKGSEYLRPHDDPSSCSN